MSFLGILELLATGVVHTLLVTLACFGTGLGVGLAIALLRRLGVPGLGAPLWAFVYVFRGVPVLVLLFIVFFGLPQFGIDVPPVAKLASASSSRCNAMLVRMPSTAISESAICMRRIACSRVSPQASTLAIIES